MSAICLNNVNLFANQTKSGVLTFNSAPIFPASFTGILTATSGVLSATSGTIPVNLGGTGVTTAPAAGNLLTGNNSGGYTPLSLLTDGTVTIAVDPVAGAITLTLPQAVRTASAVQFGSLGLGAAPSASGLLKLAAGSTSAAPIMFTSSASALLASPTVDAFEYDGTWLYMTDKAAKRHQLAFNDLLGYSAGQIGAALNWAGNPVTITSGGTGLGAVGSSYQSLITNAASNAMTWSQMTPAGTLAITVAGSTVTLTAAQAQCADIIITGTLSANVVVGVPNGWAYNWVVDATGVIFGSYTLTLQQNSGGVISNVALNALYPLLVYSTGSKLAGVNLTPSSAIWTGQPIGQAYGGLGFSLSSAANGSLLIGTGAGMILAILTAGPGISITNSAGNILITNTGMAGSGASGVTALNAYTGSLTIAGTANQVVVTPSGGTTITLSTPQNIHTAATPTFAALTLSNNTNQLVLGTTNTVTITMAALAASYVWTIPAVTDTFVGVGATQTLTNKTWNGVAITVPYGGTGIATATAYAVICAGTTATGAWQALASVGTNGQILTSNGAGALPSFKSAPGGPGSDWTGNPIPAQYGGTGIANNTASTITITGAFSLGLTLTAGTSLTLPTSGTLATTAVATLSSLVSVGTLTTGTWNATVIAPAYGGTGVANGSSNTITFTGNYTLGITLSGATAVTLPTSGTLITASVATLSSLTSVGTIGTGVWQGTVVAGAYGGTGVANSGKTITLGGNLTTSGAFACTFTLTNTTSVTLPTSGTLVNSAVTTLSSLVSVGTLTTGTWNATVIGPAYGGTGVANNAASTLAISGAFGTTLTVTNTTSVTLPTSGTLAALSLAQSWTKTQIGVPAVLSVSSNLVAVDLSLGNNFSLQLQNTTGQTLSNPTNAAAGTSGQIAITQSASSASTLSYGTNWYEVSTGTAPSVSTTLGARNLLSYYVFDSTHIYFVLNKAGVA